MLQSQSAFCLFCFLPIIEVLTFSLSHGARLHQLQVTVPNASKSTREWGPVCGFSALRPFVLLPALVDEARKSITAKVWGIHAHLLWNLNPKSRRAYAFMSKKLINMTEQLGIFKYPNKLSNCGLFCHSLHDRIILSYFEKDNVNIKYAIFTLNK